MTAEIGIKIKQIVIQKGHINHTEGVQNDITFISEEGEHIHLCGDNNIIKLLNDAIKEYENKAVFFDGR